MSKKLIGIIVVIIIILAGIGIYIAGNDTQTAEEVNQTQNETSSNNSAMQGDSLTSGKLADIFKSGKNVECTFQDMKTAGTIFVANKGEKIRADFTTTLNTGKTEEGHMIREGNWNYIWGAGLNQGFKSEVSEADKDTLVQVQQGSSVDSSQDFDCKNWNTDNSKFSLPGGVEFMDMSAQLQMLTPPTPSKQTQPGAGDSPTPQISQCASCNQIQDPAGKQQCLQILGCN